MSENFLQLLWLEPWIADTTDIPSSDKRPYFPQRIHIQEDTIHFIGSQFNASYKIHQWDISRKMYKITPLKSGITDIHSSIMGQMTILIPDTLFLMDVWSGSKPSSSPKYLLIYIVSSKSKKHPIQGLVSKRVCDILEEVKKTLS
jgi:hypothetical protein